MQWSKALALLVAVIAPPASASVQDGPPFTDALRAARLAITVEGRKLAGPGGEAIRAATLHAQFVLLGEDHGISQIPQFAAALCTQLAPLGFHRIELEISPSVAPTLERIARAPDGAAQLAAFDKRYPDSIAFYTWREEFEFLQACEKSSSQGYEIRGLDQDFIGDSTYVLTQISELKLRPLAKPAVEQLLVQDKAARHAAEQSGNPGDLLLIAAKQEELDRVADILRREGPAEAAVLFDSLLASRSIYEQIFAGAGYASNRERAKLMKRLFRADYVDTQSRDAAPAKVVFKFGAYHVGRGMNGLHSSEIGDYVSELAEGRGQASVHILIFGVKGTQSQFAGIGKPYAVVKLDATSDSNSQLAWAKPLIGNLLDKSWTLFDVRSLRDKFGNYHGVDPELERMVFAYDFVILIPEPSASHPLASAGSK
jgi:hypothetical protein